jgi:hypothetical protein
LNGKPLKGATLSLGFDGSRIGGVYKVISGGTFGLSSRCGVGLGEGEHALTVTDIEV